MKRTILLAMVAALVLVISAAAWAELDPDEKLEIGKIAQKYLPGHHVLIEECMKGTRVVVGDKYEGTYYSFYILAPEYDAIGNSWYRLGYKKQAETIRRKVLEYLNRSGGEMLERNKDLPEMGK